VDIKVGKEAVVLGPLLRVSHLVFALFCWNVYWSLSTFNKF